MTFVHIDILKFVFPGVFKNIRSKIRTASALIQIYLEGKAFVVAAGAYQRRVFSINHNCGEIAGQCD